MARVISALCDPDLLRWKERKYHTVLSLSPPPSLSPSLSLSLYIYIYICICSHLCGYINKSVEACWPNGYNCHKWNLPSEFKFWTQLFAFHFRLMSLAGKLLASAPGPVLDFGPERGPGKGTMADLGPLIRHLVSTRLPSGGRAAFLSPLSPLYGTRPCV